jgi:hypothetical protein
MSISDQSSHFLGAVSRAWQWVTPNHIIAATSVVALLFAAWQIHRARKQAQIQHLLQIDHEFTGQPFIAYRSALAKKRLAGETEPLELYRVLDFFETIGLLVRRKYLDPYDVWNMYSHWIFNVYAEFKGMIADYRSEDPTYYAEFERLLQKLRKIETRESGTLLPPTGEEIADFWRDEAQLQPGSHAPRARGIKRNVGVERRTS